MGRLKISALYLLLFGIGGIAACTRAPQKIAPAPVAPSVPADTSLSVVRWSDPLDPRQEWLEDLLEPRFGQMAALRWQCTRNRSWLQVDLKGLGISCEEALRTNLAHSTSATPYCSGSFELQLRAHEGDCQSPSGSTPPSLQAWRMPAGWGLYRHSEKGTLSPNLERHPSLSQLATLRWAQEGASVHSPHWSTWLASSSERGALHLALRPVDNGHDNPLLALAALNQFVGPLHSPRRLRVSSALLNRGQAVANVAGPPPGAIEINTPYKDPLLAEPCQYVSAWLQAQLLLNESAKAPRSAARNAPPLRLECRYIWAHQVPNGPFLSLARLPLPLALNGERLPFVSVEDSFSPSRLLLALSKSTP